MSPTDCLGQVLALCDSNCNHSWASEKLAKKLKLQGPPTKLTVSGINSQQTIHTQIFELKLILNLSGDSHATLSIKFDLGKNFNIGTDFIDVIKIKQQYPHFEQVTLSEYSYADEEMILGQDSFHLIRPLEYFESGRQDTPLAVLLLMV